mmetsp:Transcript_27203/g.56290  ORF Transcript_27203/g.56290 Transcript_27203/m.56290 type:complete len:253 (+) Transcript_27203:1013-1771(+)
MVIITDVPTTWRVIQVPVRGGVYGMIVEIMETSINNKCNSRSSHNNRNIHSQECFHLVMFLHRLLKITLSFQHQHLLHRIHIQTHHNCHRSKCNSFRRLLRRLVQTKTRLNRLHHLYHKILPITCLRNSLLHRLRLRHLPCLQTVQMQHHNFRSLHHLFLTHHRHCRHFHLPIPRHYQLQHHHQQHPKFRQNYLRHPKPSCELPRKRPLPIFGLLRRRWNTTRGWRGWRSCSNSSYSYSNNSRIYRVGNATN